MYGTCRFGPLAFNNLSHTAWLASMCTEAFIVFLVFILYACPLEPL